MRILIFIISVFAFDLARAQSASELDKLLGTPSTTKDELPSGSSNSADSNSDAEDEDTSSKSLYSEDGEEDTVSESGTAEKEPPPKNLTNLGKLQPFSDIAVIQKRFLPKTSRFEFFPSLGLVANNSFFWNVILSGKFGYYFTESLGIEASFAFITSEARKVTNDLEDNLRVEIEEIVIPESYYGLDFKWSPIYAKFGLTDTMVVPFDMYFLLGAGITQTNQDTSPFTFHFGTGQIFALSKYSALRWDLGWYFYNSESKKGTISGSFTDMYLTVGLSFFFPEAKYR